MKKIAYVLATSIAMFASSCGISLPDSPAANILKGDKPNFEEARKLAKIDRESATFTDKAYAELVSANVENALFDSELTKMMLPTEKADTVTMYKALLNSVPFFLKAYDLDQKQPNEKGEVKPRFAKDIKSTLEKNLPYFLNAGDYFLKNEKYEDAFSAFNEYLNLKKNPIFVASPVAVADSLTMNVAYFALASAYQSKMYDKVIAMASDYKDDALQTKENRDNIYQMLSASYAEKGDTTSYLKVLSEGAELFDNSYYLGNIVNVYSLQNKIDDAIKFLEKAIAQKPNNVAFLNAMGSLFERKEDFNTAANWYKRILEIEPDNFDGNYNYARGLYNQAVTMLSADKIDKLTQDKAKALYKDSLPYFEKAYKMNPSQVYYILGSVYNSLGMQKEYERVMSENK